MKNFFVAVGVAVGLYVLIGLLWAILRVAPWCALALAAFVGLVIFVWRVLESGKKEKKRYY